MVNALLSECVIAYLGVPGQLDPEPPEQRVVDAAGEDALDMLPAVTAIIDAVHAVEPPLHGFRTVAEMGEAVGLFLRTTHPELSDRAIEALANSYAYQWK